MKRPNVLIELDAAATPNPAALDAAAGCGDEWTASMNPKFNLVDTAEGLQPLLAEIALHETVAVDTEADSLHHYREKLCLLQLGVGERQWIVDPLAPLALGELARLLERRELILHGADYDLRLLHRTFHFKAERIFDTMLAAQLVGRPRIGLAALVEEYFGVVLPKKGQKADWSRRPLPAELLEYAADDTRYLEAAKVRLREELAAKGRLAWHGEICRRQIAASRQTRQIDRTESWRIKGGKHLTGRAAAVLRELWHWREEAARRADRPPFKIASNEFLLHWAQWIVEQPHATLEEAPERPAWLVGSRLKSFNGALATALALPRAAWPGPPPARGGPRRALDEELLLGRILAARDKIARRLEMDPGVLGSREALREVVRRRPQTAPAPDEGGGLMDWQLELLMPAILPIMKEGEDGPAAAGIAQMGDEPTSLDGADT